MTYRHRALIALVLAGALTAAGFAAASAARDSRSRTRSSERSDRADRGAGFLGVNLQDLSEDLADSYDYDGSGVVVSSVVDGSPADKAGIREGDIITRFNGTSVNSADQLTRRVRALSPGTLADISVWRDGKERDLDRVEIGNVDEANGNDREWAPRVRRYNGDLDEAPVPPRAPRAPRAPRTPATPRMRTWNFGPEMRGLDMMQMGRGRLGVETRDLDSDLGEYFDTPDGKGVLVLRVMEDTPAAEAGLKAGDVILSIDGDDVDNSDELRKEIRSKKAGPVEIRIRRKGTERTLSATLAEAEEFGNGQNWLGDLYDNDNDNDNDWNGPRVFRLHPNGGDPQWFDGDGGFQMDGMSDEDKAQLKKDLQKLREDLREMRRDKRSDR